jgi:hypothetical protein
MVAGGFGKVPDHVADLAEYIRDHYGICKLSLCICVKEHQPVAPCPNWQPVKARNWEELMKEVLDDQLSVGRAPV